VAQRARWDDTGSGWETVSTAATAELGMRIELADYGVIEEEEKKVKRNRRRCQLE
jgi:hypothetical protein